MSHFARLSPVPAGRKPERERSMNEKEFAQANAEQLRGIEDSGVLAQLTPPPSREVNWPAFAALVAMMIATAGGLIYFMTREQPCSSVIAAYENRPAIQRPTAQEAVQYRQCKR